MNTNVTYDEFMSMLASKSPIPGGGGASALAGAIGTALASMVANLTVGKKKYAEYEKDLEYILEKASAIRHELLDLIKKDAEVFEPLSRAYSLPKETEEQQQEKDLIMEAALKKASLVPLEIMRKAHEAIALHEELLTKGSVIAVSDVGVGVIMCKAAIQGASLNVFINTKYMKDREYAQQLNDETNTILGNSLARADIIFDSVVVKLVR
jgi:formiminotetrahydrofolate cyclodeaminase